MKHYKFKKETFIGWIIFILIILSLYFIKKDLFNIEFLKNIINQNKIIAILIYIAILSLIGLTFIPSTPFTFTGFLLFNPIEAYIYNLIGIITSSTIVYYFTKYIGLDTYFDKRYHKKIIKIKKKLKNKVMPIIIGWSFFPIVPTDLIIYVSSSMNIKYKKCVLGVLVGEGILNLFYLLSAYGIILIY